MERFQGTTARCRCFKRSFLQTRIIGKIRQASTRFESGKEFVRGWEAGLTLGQEILERPPGFWGTQRAIEELREWRPAFLGRVGSTLLEGVHPSQEVGPEPNGSAPLSQLGEQGLWEDNAAPAPSPGGERETSLLLSFPPNEPPGRLARTRANPSLASPPRHSIGCAPSRLTAVWAASILASPKLFERPSRPSSLTPLPRNLR